MKGDCVAGVFGARDQGKTSLAAAIYAAIAPTRALLFDPMNQFGHLAERVPTVSALLTRARAERAFAYRYVPQLDDHLAKRFNAFCSVALDVGRALVLVDELQLVTRASWSPPSWFKVVLVGRHAPHELRIIATSQRPALVDATFRSNMSVAAAFRVNFPADVRALAEMIGTEPERIAGLPRHHYLARDMNTGTVTPGTTKPLAKPARR